MKLEIILDTRPASRTILLDADSFFSEESSGGHHVHLIVYGPKPEQVRLATIPHEHLIAVTVIQP